VAATFEVGCSLIKSEKEDLLFIESFLFTEHRPALRIKIADPLMDVK
jgi:hypothetical protein